MIRARAGSLPTSAGQAGPLPGGASDLRVLKQLGKLRAPRFLSKRNGPSIHTATQAFPGKPKSMTRFAAGKGVPCSVIQKAVAATWAHHSSHRTPLHLESLPHWQGFISWVMDSHIRQLHLTKGQKAQTSTGHEPNFLHSFQHIGIQLEIRDTAVGKQKRPSLMGIDMLSEKLGTHLKPACAFCPFVR